MQNDNFFNSLIGDKYRLALLDNPIEEEYEKPRKKIKSKRSKRKNKKYKRKYKKLEKKNRKRKKRAKKLKAEENLIEKIHEEARNEVMRILMETQSNRLENFNNIRSSRQLFSPTQSIPDIYETNFKGD